MPANQQPTAQTAAAQSQPDDGSGPQPVIDGTPAEVALNSEAVSGQPRERCATPCGEAGSHAASRRNVASAADTWLAAAQQTAAARQSRDAPVPDGRALRAETADRPTAGARIAARAAPHASAVSRRSGAGSIDRGDEDDGDAPAVLFVVLDAASMTVLCQAKSGADMLTFMIRQGATLGDTQLVAKGPPTSGSVTLSRSGAAKRAGDGRRQDMNIEKYSERVRGFIQSAQTMALSRNHQQFTPEHLLKVLLDDEEGLAASLIERAGGTCRATRSSASRRRSSAAAASRAATASSIWRSRWPRSFRPPRSWPRRPATASSPSSGCCTALAIEKSAKTADILAKAGVTPQALNQAINDIRKGRTADSASAEQGYDALKKYARDLTADARDGKLDPVIGRDDEIRRTIQVLSRRTKNNPGADRRARRRQDGHRRRPGAAHRQWRRAGNR